MAWRDLPREFGPWQTVWKRQYEFCNDGTWDKVLTALEVAADARGEIDWRVSVDSTIARVHQQGATAARSQSKPTSYTGGTTYLHLCAQVLGERVFFEVVQRIGDDDDHGAANAPVRIAAHRTSRRPEHAATVHAPPGAVTRTG